MSFEITGCDFQRLPIIPKYNCRPPPTYIALLFKVVNIKGLRLNYKILFIHYIKNEYTKNYSSYMDGKKHNSRCKFILCEFN